MPEDGVVCLDNGIYKIWFARNYCTHVANTLSLDNALATMGAGWRHAPKPWRRAARRSIAPVSVWCAGEVKGAAAGAPARTVLGRSRGSFAFQASET